MSLSLFSSNGEGYFNKLTNTNFTRVITRNHRQMQIELKSMRGLAHRTKHSFLIASKFKAMLPVKIGYYYCANKVTNLTNVWSCVCRRIILEKLLTKNQKLPGIKLTHRTKRKKCPSWFSTLTYQYVFLQLSAKIHQCF